MQHNPRPVPTGPGLRPVWDYPRRPWLEDVSKPVRVVFDGVTIAETMRAIRVLEAGHPPTYYIPRNDVRMERLEAVSGASSYCEWKGVARYFDVRVNDRQAKRAAWSYPQPMRAFSAIRNHLAFYAEPMDGCYVGDERVLPQPGAFHGGWITGGDAGPFREKVGSRGR